MMVILIEFFYRELVSVMGYGLVLFMLKILLLGLLNCLINDDPQINVLIYNYYKMRFCAIR